MTDQRLREARRALRRERSEEAARRYVAERARVAGVCPRWAAMHARCCCDRWVREALA